MSRTLLTLILAIFPLTAWSAPVCVDPEQPGKNHTVHGGIGGTGSPLQSKAPDQNPSSKTTSGGGIGGTGSPAVGGIGGTGMPVAAATSVGIVGVISGFASVCVNGVEVHFENTTPISDNGNTSSAQQLAVGQIVSIEANNTPKGLQAKEISVIHALEGPITHIPRGGKSMEVLGQTVAMGPDTRIGGRNLAVGQQVKVSALLGANGMLFATRIQLAPGLQTSSALGQVTLVGKQAKVNGVPVAGTLTGNSILVKGHWTGV